MTEAKRSRDAFLVVGQRADHPSGRGDRRVDNPRADDADTDARRRPLRPQAPRERHDRRLGCAVGGHVAAHDVGGSTGHVDDLTPAAAEHRRTERAAAVGHAVQVDAHQPVPVLDPGLEERPGDPHPGVVDQDVNGADLALDRLGQGVDRPRIGDVAGESLGIRPALPAALRGAPRPVGVDVDADDLRAQARKASRCGRADPAAGARDEHPHRRVPIIFTPRRGRRVRVASGSTRWPGTRSKTKRWLSIAVISVVSINAKLEPMQMRLPPPNGK